MYPRAMRLGCKLLLLLGLGGCTSSPDRAEPDPASGPDTTVFDHCVDFASRLCADAKGCCMGAYGAFSQQGCLDTFQREVCRPGADSVTAGRATFHEDAVDACLEAHAAAHAVCTPNWQETLELRRKIYTACRVLDGKAEPGRPCAISADCKKPDGAGTAECVKNVCQVVAILPEGAECPFPSGSVSVCDAGLACDAPGLDSTGHCTPAVAMGEPCDPSVLESTACGLGSYCDATDGVCKEAINMGGKDCSQSTECVSFECDRLASECAPAPAVLSRDTCLGKTK
jgi:hypothetical protein